MTEKKVYTTGEAAKICNLSQMTIIRCFESGLLKGFKEPEKNLRRIYHDSLLAFMHRNNIPLFQDRIIIKPASGFDGKEELFHIITKLKTALPSTIAGMKIVSVKDYLYLPPELDIETKPLTEPNEYLFIIELEKPDNFVAIKPTELIPKRLNLPNRWSRLKRIEMLPIIKIHLVTHLPLSEFQDIEAGIAVLQSRLDAMKADLVAVIE